MVGKNGVRVLVAGVVGLISSAALAAIIPTPPAIVATISDGTVTMPVVFPAPTFNSSTQEYTYSVSNMSLGDGVTINHFDIDCSTDPILSTDFAATNNSSQPKTFQITALLPAVVPSPTTIKGSIAGSITDGDGNGAATLTAGLLPYIYTASIDNQPVIQLLQNPSFQTNASTTFGPASLGIPNGVAGPAVLTGLKAETDFTLSAGDLVSYTSSFNVQAVPEPALLSMLGVAGILSVGRRRRR